MSKGRFFVSCGLGLVALVLLLRLSPPLSNNEDRDFVAPQTWQLTGWRQLTSTSASWELGGQKVPPLSYERVGEGYQWTSRGETVIQTPSLPGFASLRLTHVSAGPTNNRLPRLMHWGESKRDGETGLPAHFKLQLPNQKAPLGELTGQYNRPLPPAFLAPPPHHGPTLDLTQPLRALPAQTNTFAGQGITLQGSLLAQDSEGNLHARLKLVPGQPGLPSAVPFSLENVWIGIQPRPKPVVVAPPVKQEQMPLSGVSSPSSGGGGMTPAYIAEREIQDSQSERYTVLFLPDQGDNQPIELYFVRLTPRSTRSPLPKTITFSVDTDLVWLPEFRPYFDLTTFHTVHQRLTLSIPPQLPTEPLSQATKEELDKKRQFQKAILKDQNRQLKEGS